MAHSLDVNLIEPDPDELDEAEDRALVRRYLANRGESEFRLLYRRHTPPLWRTALRFADNESDAEEIVQETWVRAAQRLEGFRWGSTLSSWLQGIARNVRRELQRSRRRDRGTGRPALALVKPSRPDLAVDLEQAVADLPQGYREVLVLHDVEGHTHEEVAAILGIEPGTSKSQLSRARQALRRLLSVPRSKSR